MKKQTSKKEVRNQLQQQMDDFLSKGGAVASIETGISGRENPAAAPPNHPFAKPKETRTPVLDSIESIEARRKTKAEPVKKPKSSGPVRKPVLDDFGEIVRWVWVEE
ncbi:MAG: hypothetical protein ACJA0M_001207 [Chitinophagales bacterium]|jgi:hypothetical protein|tara:strand:- start:2841 stop:3161 length:321 start_codon:yes stop_codon:yes gene_type:complete